MSFDLLFGKVVSIVFLKYSYNYIVIFDWFYKIKKNSSFNCYVPGNPDQSELLALQSLHLY